MYDIINFWVSGAGYSRKIQSFKILKDEKDFVTGAGNLPGFGF